MFRKKLEREVGFGSRGSEVTVLIVRVIELLAVFSSIEVVFLFQGGGQNGIGKRVWRDFVVILVQIRVVVVERDVYVGLGEVQENKINRVGWDIGERER